MIKKIFVTLVLGLIPFFLNAQDISLFQQFHGNYDYTAIGNTLNASENGINSDCTILSESAANLELTPSQTVVAAYLYWAGSGSGDFEIQLNAQSITSERTFNYTLDENRMFFAAFSDVTELVLSTSNGNYNVSELDNIELSEPYCSTGTNFAGWAMVIVYHDENLPINQLNVYDGLQTVPSELSINLDNINVVDTEGAKIGFIAWEGDSSLAVNESLRVNGNLISNPPLNPEDNAFNGTNSFTGSSSLFNMDIDVYNIQNNIEIGDDSATINLTSGQDLVMINNVITVLNSQLPDASVLLENIYTNCNSRLIDLHYRIQNAEGSQDLISGIPIAIYSNDLLQFQTATPSAIAVGESIQMNTTLEIPPNLGNNFTIKIAVDDNGFGMGIVTELMESNNEAVANVSLSESAPIRTLPTLEACLDGNGYASFNLENNLLNVEVTLLQNAVQFYENEEDAVQMNNAIANPNFYQTAETNYQIYVRFETEPCYQLAVFDIQAKECNPEIPNGFSPNGDGYNDWFNIQGLYDVFYAHELLVYNRYGKLIFVGDNDHKWYGFANRGTNSGNKKVPVGTYYYVLKLNNNTPPLIGWVYLNY